MYTSSCLTISLDKIENRNRMKSNIKGSDLLQKNDTDLKFDKMTGGKGDD